MNRERARYWQSRPFKPSWLEPLTMQRTGDLQSLRLWLIGNIPVMLGTDIIKARKYLAAVKAEQQRRHNVRVARIQERAAARKLMKERRLASAGSELVRSDRTA